MWPKNEKKPVLQYIFLAFLIAWCALALLILGEKIGVLTGTAGVISYFIIVGLGAGLAPMYAVFILLKRHEKIRGIKDFCKLIFRTSYIIKTIIATTLFALAFLILNILNNDYLHEPWYLFILSIPLMIIGGGLEEVGWRGFLQPALENKVPFFLASLISGILWAIWHFPLWFVQNASQSSMNFISFACYCIMGAFVLAALYKLTKSVFACVLIHASSNAFGNIFTMDILTRPIGIKLIVTYLILIFASIVIGAVVDKKNKTLLG